MITMSSATTLSIWPKGQDDEVLKLINLYFNLVDSKEANAGQRLAEEVFAKKGKWYASLGFFEGHGKCNQMQIYNFSLTFLG